MLHYLNMETLENNVPHLLNFDANLFVLGLSCTFGFVLILIIHYYNQSKRPIGKSEQGCTNPDCVRCTAKASLYLTIQERMRCVIANPSVLDVSDRLQKSFEHFLKFAGRGGLQDSVSVGASKLQNPTVFYLQNLSHCHHFEDHERLSFCEAIKTMQTHSEEVKEEFNGLWNEFVDGGNHTGWEENILQDGNGKWFAFHLINQGLPQRSNLDRSPATSKLLQKIEAHLMRDSIFSFATFSMIMPGTHIDRHCGATNIRARCHLGLDIPEGCTLTVNQEKLKWTEGDCLVFDDSFQHEVHHSGDSRPRGVLMVDLWHPELTLGERKHLKYVFHSDLLETVNSR